MKKALVLVIGFTVLPLLLLAQTKPKAERAYVKGWLIEANYAHQLPIGILHQRFSTFSSPGLALSYHRNNWQFGFESNFLFGGKVRADSALLVGIVDQYGYLISNDGYQTEYSFELRGAMFRIQGAKVFSLKPETDEGSGILLRQGIGYIQHKIMIKADPETLPQLSTNYKKGYDRYCNGFLSSTFLGYQRLREKGFLNFSAGLELNIGATSMKRSWQFDQDLAGNTMLAKRRTDVSVGLKASWYIPVLHSSGNKRKIYY